MRPSLETRAVLAHQTVRTRPDGTLPLSRAVCRLVFKAGCPEVGNMIERLITFANYLYGHGCVSGRGLPAARDAAPAMGKRRRLVRVECNCRPSRLVGGVPLVMPL
jgi:hypothetical protein